MSLLPMAPGGRWMRPPHDAPPVYVPAKQIEAHYKRLVGENWVPLESDPRKEDQQTMTHAEVQAIVTETAMQARIDQLEALVSQQAELVKQLLAQKSEQHDASTDNASSANSQGPNADQRSVRRKPAI